MKKIILIALILILFSGSASASWYDSNYSYMKPIVINHSYVSETVLNHTLLINITDTNLRDRCRTDGNDIIFVDADNTIQLDHQIEGEFNSTTGHLKAWVRIPSINNVSDTIINMYYNYSSAVNTENPSGVWGVNASGIWLMDEGTGSWANDSSGNDNNGTVNGCDWVENGLELLGIETVEEM